MVGDASRRPTCGPEQKIGWPPDEKVLEYIPNGQCIGHRCNTLRLFLCFAIGVFQRSLLWDDVRAMRLALGEVIRPGVVHCVTSLPREVRNQQCRVQNVTNCALQGLIVAEGAMATLMSRRDGDGQIHHTIPHTRESTTGKQIC